MVILAFFLILLLSLGLTKCQLLFFGQGRLIDTPDERSSHQQPTPTSGGAAICLAFYLSCALIALICDKLFFNPLLLVLPLFVVGLIDDFNPLPAKVRLFAQSLFALLLLWSIGSASFSLLWDFVLFLAIVWWLNLFNFMDGTDGLAAGECVFLCAAMLWLTAGLDYRGHLPLAVLLAASWGFLFFNAAPAKIFMGDAGSMLLAGLTVVIACDLIVTESVSAWALLILAAGFAADSTMTLLIRVLKRENLAAAHRSHLYQQLARYWGSHQKVAISYSAVNVVFLFPLALIANNQPNLGLMLTIIAYFPLCLAVIISHRRFLTIG